MVVEKITESMRTLTIKGEKHDLKSAFRPTGRLFDLNLFQKYRQAWPRGRRLQREALLFLTCAWLMYKTGVSTCVK